MLGRRSEAKVDIDGPWRDRAMMATIGLTIQPLDMTKDGALSLWYDITFGMGGDLDLEQFLRNPQRTSS